MRYAIEIIFDDMYAGKSGIGRIVTDFIWYENIMHKNEKIRLGDEWFTIDDVLHDDPVYSTLQCRYQITENKTIKEINKIKNDLARAMEPKYQIETNEITYEN